MERKWWKEAIGYQVYPRSFKDSNSDGIGDLNGISEKLVYLKDLGVDFIWVNPINESPNVDNGYDISDYQAILKDFGTMADFENFLQKAHKLEIKVILDLVINHTSDQHDWFQEALKGPDNPYHDYYIWKKAPKGELPNDWLSIFGGSVWTYIAELDEYYFHAFAKEQPDLNWENPRVREDVYRMISWWLEKGVAGFRVDAISHIKKKDFSLPDEKDPNQPFKMFQNVEGIGIYLKELKAVFDRYQVVSVGEASGVRAEQAEEWVGEDGYFDMIFEFDHIGLWRESAEQAVDVAEFTDALSRWQEALDYGKGWNALYMENHDVPRSVSVFGNDHPDSHEQSAKALAIAYLFLQGTPFIYQGQEIGMTNTDFSTVEELDAVDSHNLYHRLLDEGMTAEEAIKIVSQTTRDNARTPMQWDDSEYAGFSVVAPWMKVNPNKTKWNVASQQVQHSSVLSFYKQLIHLRKSSDVYLYGNFENVLPRHPQVFGYRRFLENEEVLVLVNLTQKKATYQLDQTADYELVITNQVDQTKGIDLGYLAPYEAVIYRKSAK